MNHSIKKLIDTGIGSPLCALLGIFVRKRKLLTAPKRILVIKLWALGDTITMLPMVQELRKQYPSAQVDVLCRYQNYDFAKASNLFDKMLLFELSEIFDLLRHVRHYDLVFDGEPFLRISALLAFFLGKYRVGFSHDIRRMTYNSTSAYKRQHMLENYLDMIRVIGINAKAPKNLVKLILPSNEQKAAHTILMQSGIKEGDEVVALAPSVGAEGRTRLWQQDKWAKLAGMLVLKNKAKIIFLGSTGDSKYVEEIRPIMKVPSINLCGKTNLLQTVGIVNLCKLVISLDAGIMHVASAQGVSTIGLFGPNTPELWGAYGERCRSVYHKLDCSPCIINQKGYIPDCLLKSDRYLCMRSITIDEVYNLAGEMLGTHKIPLRREHKNKTSRAPKPPARDRKSRQTDSVSDPFWKQTYGLR